MTDAIIYYYVDKNDIYINCGKFPFKNEINVPFEIPIDENYNAKSKPKQLQVTIKFKSVKLHVITNLKEELKTRHRL